MKRLASAQKSIDRPTVLSDRLTTVLSRSDRINPGRQAGAKDLVPRRSKLPLNVRLNYRRRRAQLLPAVAFLVGLLSLASCSSGPGTPSSSNNTPSSNASPAARKITSVGVVKTLARSNDVAAGETTEAIVQLTIEKGFHLNANPPTYPYLKATELEIKPADGLKPGKITYPEAITQKFAFAEGPLAVYEGQKEIKAEILTEKSASKGLRTLAAVLRVQACDDQVCYPPGTIDLQIPLTLK